MSEHDPLLMSYAEIMAVATHYSQRERVKAAQIRPAMQLREPHLTAQLAQYNDLVDDRFDWDAQVEAAA